MNGKNYVKTKEIPLTNEKMEVVNSFVEKIKEYFKEVGKEAKVSVIFNKPCKHYNVESYPDYAKEMKTYIEITLASNCSEWRDEDKDLLWVDKKPRIQFILWDSEGIFKNSYGETIGKADVHYFGYITSTYDFCWREYRKREIHDIGYPDVYPHPDYFGYGFEEHFALQYDVYIKPMLDKVMEKYGRGLK